VETPSIYKAFEYYWNQKTQQLNGKNEKKQGIQHILRDDIFYLSGPDSV